DIAVIHSDDVLGGVLNYTTGCINGGNSIQLRITVQAWAGDEFWQIDNVVLECGTNPTVDAGPDLNVCNGSSITLAASNPDNAILTWDNGITDGIAFSPSLGTTTYTVTATSGSCVSTDQVDITVTSSISFTLTSINPTTCLGG